MKNILANASQEAQRLNPHLSGQASAPKSATAGNVARSMAIRRGRMNKTESEFALKLEAQKREGKILRYEFEGVTLRFSGVKYTPDFVVFEDCEAMLNFSHSAFSSETKMATNKGMAASAERGTAPKLGLGKCAGPTSASNSQVRCDVTAGETAPVPNGSEKVYRLRFIEIKGGYTKGKFERAVERFRHARTYFPELTFELWRKTKDFGWRREL